MRSFIIFILPIVGCHASVARNRLIRVENAVRQRPTANLDNEYAHQTADEIEKEFRDRMLFMSMSADMSMSMDMSTDNGNGSQPGSSADGSVGGQHDGITKSCEGLDEFQLVVEIEADLIQGLDGIPTDLLDSTLTDALHESHATCETTESTHTNSRSDPSVRSLQMRGESESITLGDVQVQQDDVRVTCTPQVDGAASCYSAQVILPVFGAEDIKDAQAKLSATLISIFAIHDRFNTLLNEAGVLDVRLIRVQTYDAETDVTPGPKDKTEGPDDDEDFDQSEKGGLSTKPNQPRDPSVGVIVGLVLSAALIVLAGVGAYANRLRRKRRHERQSMKESETQHTENTGTACSDATAHLLTV